MKLLRTTDSSFRRQFSRLTEGRASGSAEVEETVYRILSQVRQHGDRALLTLTKRFDRHLPKILEVTRGEIREAWRMVGRPQMDSLRLAARRIERFHHLQLRKYSRSWKIRERGTVLGEKITPLSRIGIYVPGGLAVYPSTVLMNAIPARVAGVDEIIMCSPWTGGVANPYTLVAADLVGIKRVFKIGGAQAIAAMAYGTESIPAVDKIVGPGNIFVATAKRLVFGMVGGKVGIDMIAGPTEIVIVADETARPEFVAADLLSQAEHDPRALAILMTPSQKLAQAVMKQIQQETILKDRVTLLLTRTVAEAISLVNSLAPEHLSLQIRNPAKAVQKIKNAGAIFLGPWSPVAVGDYLAGPNHVLPTSGTARFSSPLGVSDFLKRSSLIEIQRPALARLGPHVVRLAHLEGLTAHASSVEIRIRDKE